MNRPQRTLKPTQRLIEQDVQQPKRNTPKPAKRTLNLDIPKVNVKDNVVDDVVNKPKVTKRKVKSGVQTTLHLDLSDVPQVMTENIRKIGDLTHIGKLISILQMIVLLNYIKKLLRN